MRWLDIVVTLGLLVTACADELQRSPERSSGAASRRGSPLEHASGVGGHRCPNEPDTVASGERIGGLLHGDVDGDGSEDQVFIVMDRVARVGCEAFVVVEGMSTASAPIWRMGAAGGLPQPTLHSLVDLDGTGGVEVVVNEAGGASTQFVGALTWQNGDLARLTLDASERELWAGQTQGLFPFGGSVGHVEATDCAAGKLVVSVAVPRGRRYAVTRWFLTPRGATLQLASVERRRVPLAEVQRFPEFAAAPFGSC